MSLVFAKFTRSVSNKLHTTDSGFEVHCLPLISIGKAIVHSNVFGQSESVDWPREIVNTSPGTRCDDQAQEKSKI